MLQEVKILQGLISQSSREFWWWDNKKRRKKKKWYSFILTLPLCTELTVAKWCVISLGQRRVKASHAEMQYSLSSSSSTATYWTMRGMTRSRYSPNLWPAWRLGRRRRKILLYSDILSKTLFWYLGYLPTKKVIKSNKKVSMVWTLISNENQIH